jgi:hypothetical protein
MRSCGVTVVMHSLTESYVRNSYQRVRFNKKLSNWGKINTEILQGSILGPLLFLIYLNDLPSFIQNAAPSNISVVLFANDTCVIINEVNFTYLERKLTLVLRLMIEQLRLNVLSLNFNKTCSRQFTTIKNLLIG